MSRSRCLLVASAAGQQPAGRTVAATGVASVKVRAPSDRTHEAPIRAAVEAAEAKALPRALADARAKAADLAKLSGLTLGGIESISDATASPYGPFGGSTGPSDRIASAGRSAPRSSSAARTAGVTVSAVGHATRAACPRPSHRPSP